MQNKQQFGKVSKRCKSYIPSLRNVGSDDLNYVWFENTLNLIYIVRNIGNDDLNIVCHSWHGAHHRIRNFVKAKMCKTNSKFEKFQNAVNLIYTVYGVLEMLMKIMFGIVSMVRIIRIVSKRCKSDIHQFTECRK